MAAVLKKQTTIPPHVVFLPYAMTSHITPLVHIARLFAYHGLRVTIITTPHNALIFQSSIDNDRCLVPGCNISVQTLKFPSYEMGLPDGVENFSACPSLEIAGKVHYGFFVLLQKPMEQLIRNLKPQCIVSDMFFPWTIDLAEELNIPRFSFQTANFFFQCVWHCLREYAPHEKVALDSDDQSFLIPGLPHEIKMKLSEIEDFFFEDNFSRQTYKAVREAELRSQGIIHNTCSELEPEYVDIYENIRGVKGWHVGPTFLFINELEKSQNSNPTCFDDPWKKCGDCLNWLEDQEPNSVLFVCFGSSVRFSNDQLKEIALALNAAKCPFILVAKEQGNKNQLEEKDDNNYGDWWQLDSFKELVVNNKRCFIVKGWAPQVLILEHRAIGGFLTHCGWNSVLEALTMGIPLITWPLFAEQFYNQKLLVLLGLAIEVGSDVWNSGFIVSSPVVSREKIELAIERLMYDSEERKKIRANAKLMAEKVKSSAEEGGSSHSHLIALIEEIKHCATFNSST
ncbi:nuatigenin 3-beta-glucosyltransferase-like [Lycium ferocissimum]|uniref:nuatigenin 3-beta-glucosyltransferase-like n=1 Tax=Lycium ferocissimum TaxID=112874 RepID=UPI002815DD2C|nr:nuatigenin 3-beta-glucosyltransferase-like [Lycium ferocissimum]